MTLFVCRRAHQKLAIACDKLATKSCETTSTKLMADKERSAEHTRSSFNQWPDVGNTVARLIFNAGDGQLSLMDTAYGCQSPMQLSTMVQSNGSGGQHVQLELASMACIFPPTQSTGGIPAP